ncbi:hypothetical protein BTR14_03095 [Rhizobium rhizosphaerae]|uniref:Toprim domain-containing protein n=1 Tax=Xaviernesmea rhizosphaerae TaxID=1672749 RepID=A0ABX3PHE7_9HYPH|nr:toprim domain-containing protein [Xaviernesmea rhizosphaerae]OQP87571.1 hypothetical protein BTR14_03095 [Xaviernesmea rhizosphaerae]
MSEARRIVSALKGHWHGRYGLACCPAHADRTPSLSIRDAGERLLLRCHAGCGFSDILGALRGLGIVAGGGDYSPPSAEDWEAIRREDEEHARKQEARALECWRASEPIGGTPAETYLRARGITCALPDSLRYHSDCYHPSTARLPAMVALVEGAERFAVHRTYLRADGLGKADADPQKAMLGAVGGGAVRLTSGGGRLAVCEGIETGLSLASGLIHGSPTIWAALSTSGMKRLALPAVPGSLLIATDGDEPGRAAGNVLAESATVAGWSVSILPAPNGRDFNDILLMKGRAA